MEFRVSKTEINRRKKAFATLLMGLVIGSPLFTKLFDFSFVPGGYLFIVLASFIIGVITFQYLNSLLQIRIRILDQGIERQKGSNIEKYLIAEIDSIKIKRRTNGTIREIYLSFHNRKLLYINAFEEYFESLKDALVSKIDSKVSVKEIHEPLDFDHALFYPILGLLISCTSVFTFNQMMQADYSTMRIALLLFSAYTFCLSIYFILKKPISVRSYKRQVVVDYIFGLSMILASILMAAIGILL